jgi:hypothetical protein
MDIIDLVYKARRQHGIRHQDYRSYHAFCDNKLRRLRRRLKRSEGTESLKLELELFETERAYAYAEALKTNMGHSPRAKFHITKRLNRAVQHAKKCVSIVTCKSEKLAACQAQCHAYSGWINAVEALHKKDWKAAAGSISEAMAWIEILKSNFARQKHGEDDPLQVVLGQPLEQLLRYLVYLAQSSNPDISKNVQEGIKTLKLEYASKMLSISEEQGMDFEEWSVGSQRIDQVFPGLLSIPITTESLELLKVYYETNRSKVYGLLEQWYQETIEQKQDHVDTKLELESAMKISGGYSKHCAKVLDQSLKTDIKGDLGSFILLEATQTKILISTINSWLVIPIDPEQDAFSGKIQRGSIWKAKGLFKQVLDGHNRINSEVLREKGSLVLQKAMQYRIDLAQLDLLWVNMLDLHRRGQYFQALQLLLNDQKLLSILLALKKNGVSQDLEIYSGIWKQLGVSIPLEIHARVHRILTCIAYLCAIWLRFKDPSMLGARQIMTELYGNIVVSEASLHEIDTKSNMDTVSTDSNIPTATSSSSGLFGLFKRFWGTSPDPESAQ